MSNYVYKDTCPSCGDVMITHREVTLHLHPHPSLHEVGTYQYHCPGCYELVVKAASSSTIKRFINHGVRTLCDEASYTISKAIVDWSTAIHGTTDLFAAITEGGE